MSLINFAEIGINETADSTRIRPLMITWLPAGNMKK